MLYWLLKPLAKVALRVFFRKIYYLNEDQMPKKGPVIIVSNHPTAFIETILYPTFGKRATYNILRGDMFSTPFLKWVLSQIKTIPIFRFRDGFENMRKNQEIMDKIVQLLKNGRVISIMVEGSHQHCKRLRKVQKGAARIVFQAYEQYGDLDIQIVPLGINFSNSHQFRSVMMAKFGPPIPLQEFIEKYNQNEPRAVKQLTDTIEEKLRQHVIHIEEAADEPFVNTLLDMNRNDQRLSRFPILQREDDLLHQEIAIANQINMLDSTEKKYVREDIESYQKRLQRLGLQDIGIAKAEASRPQNTLLLLLGLVPFTIGYLLNFLPLWYASYFANKKVKKIEFHASVRLGIGLIGYVLYYLLWIVVAAVVQTWWLIGLVVVMPFLGFFALFYRDFYQKWKAARRFKYLPIDEAISIREQRKKVLAFRREQQSQVS